MIFNTQVHGIPCQCQVLLFSKGSPLRRYGTGAGDVHPPELPDLEIEILDSKGKAAPWLEAKLTPQDRARLEKEFHLERDAEAYEASH